MDIDDTLKKVANKYNLDSIGVFGSRARGDFREDSDFDIFIIGDISLSNELRLEDELAKLVDNDVDLVKLDHELDRILAKNIMNEAKVIYSKNNSYERFYNEIDSFFIENSDFIHLRERDLFD